MYIVIVIPFQKNSQKEYLSYFSLLPITLGSIVSIPLRKKEVDALVIDIAQALDMKTAIKNSEYQLRKIIKIKGNSFFNLNFFTACQKMAGYTISSTGSIIKNLLPSVLIENIEKLKKPIDSLAPEENNKIKENIINEKLIFQASLIDRIAFYRTLIREAFAKKESIFICLPTIYDINFFYKELSRGIEQYVLTFHSGFNKKILIDNYNKMTQENHPILIIGTGIFMSIARNDIKTLIIENESSDVYKQISKPYMDIRSFAEVLSSVWNIKLIYGDTLLRPETLHRYENGNFKEISSPSYRLTQPEKQSVINSKEEANVSGKKIFTIISDQTKEMINKTLALGESVFLFSVRKGLAPITVCNDCNNTLLCPSCTTPIVLYGSKQLSANKSTTNRIFMCNKCGRKEKTEVYCPVCFSWNLTPLGIGTDRVNEEIKNLYPKTNIIQIDKESTKNNKEVQQAIKNFSENPGSILIGTEMVFSYLDKKVHSSAIISLDGLFSIPSFNITQKILHLLNKLDHITTHKVIVQTRMLDNKILQHISGGNILPLYKEDLKERKEYKYPPYKRLIKITHEGSAKETEKARELIEKTLGNYEPQIFSAFIGKIKGQYITNTVIKIDPGIWPLPTDNKKTFDPLLNQKLRSLPPNFYIDIDPQDLL
jgi:primosomal protein N' (replication factor Y) (superfamily II helicase)